MREIPFAVLLDLQLEILSSIDYYCRKRGIDYFLTGGSCIGAVRHKGYIPWDDDIDIGMTRPNYDQFINGFNKEIDEHPNLKVFAPELNWDYYAPYANVCDIRTILDEGTNGHNGIDIGVKVDVFPVDGIPSDLTSFQAEKKKMRRLWNMLYLKRLIINKDEHSFIWRMNMWVKKALLSIISYERIQKKIKELAISNKFEESSYAIDVVFPWKRDVMCEKEVYEDLIDVDFEQLKVKIVKNYDRYLSLKYGDYLKLPPENERMCHHHFKAYWKD